MADPARKLADALEEYRTNLGMGRVDQHAQTVMETLERQRNDAIGALRNDIVEYAASTIIDPAHAHLITGVPDDILDRYKNRESEEQFNKRVEMVAPMPPAIVDRMTMLMLQHQADELLHAIDLARTTITGAIPLQTLDLVRGKVKDVLANLAGTIEKDMKP